MSLKREKRQTKTMLRLMKKKIQNESGSKRETTGNENGTAMMCHPICPSVVVSHIPVSVVDSDLMPASASSSISSKDVVGAYNTLVRSIQARPTSDDKQIVCLTGKKRSVSYSESHEGDSRVESSSPIVVSMKLAADNDELPSTVSRQLPLHQQIQDSRPNKKQRRLSDDDDDEIHENNKMMTRRDSFANPNIGVTLLGRDDDEIDTSLNPIHRFVRSQIEVFTATSVELSQPAPGRKQAIKLNQVGFRCIHCWNLPSRQRVKRAVCYPSTVSRVYHSVSDMKFDHFSNCTSMPADTRAEFERLKAASTPPGRVGDKKKSKPTGISSGSTSQYYQEAALRMGMTDGIGGIFLSAAPPTTTRQRKSDLELLEEMMLEAAESKDFISAAKFQKQIEKLRLRQAILRHQKEDRVLSSDSAAVQPSRPASSKPSLITPRPGRITPAAVKAKEDGDKTKRSSSVKKLLLPKNHKQPRSHITTTPKRAASRLPDDDSSRSSSMVLPHPPQPVSPENEKHVRTSLSCDDDSVYLNPLHCFVRNHVEFFTADKTDLAAPAPGRKARVALGQVGIRCIHCAKISPAKKRVKRTICYPPSIGAIYHAVSNMKFDHFDICPGLPSDSREEFQVLKAACSRRGTAGNNHGKRGPSSTSSTAQYYQDSAVSKGLIDTSAGIFFQKQNSSGTTGKESGGSSSRQATTIPAGMSVLMKAISQAA